MIMHEYTQKWVEMSELSQFVGKINDASVVTRYPEDLKKIVSVYSRRVASEYLDKTAEVLKWLRTELTK